MAKKSAAKKTNSAPASPLEILIANLRSTADELTRLTPVLDAAHSLPTITQLTQQLQDSVGVLRSQSLLSLDELATLQPAWTEVWQLSKKNLLAQAVAITGPLANPPKKDAEYCQKVLVAVIQKGGKELAIRLADQVKAEWANQLANDKSALTTHVSDKEANEHLKAWGNLTEADFLSRYTQIDEKLIQRAGALLGLKITAKSTAAKRKEFYKKAHRFAINTSA